MERKRFLLRSQRAAAIANPIATGSCAKITVKAGARMLVDEVRSGSSYVSNSDMRVHFGLGAASKIESVQVRWPSGLVEKITKNLSMISSTS